MSYLALYRQWRPQLMSEIVGQEHITVTLRNAITTGKVSHAYLFCGPRGTGKTSTAKVLARAVNCPEQHNGEPCNQCQNCREIMAGSTMDVIEIDAASNRGIDEIRELKENIKFFPTRASRQVYIVDEVHMLTNEAFNALLKTLEEPPGHVIFVLATTEPHKVPLTILSRCQRFDFRPIAAEVMARRLKQIAEKSGMAIEEGAIRAITRAAGGSLRDALSVMDQALLLSNGATVTADIVHGILGTVGEDALYGLMEALAQKNAAGVLALVDEIASGGQDLYLLAGSLSEGLRGLLVAMLAPEGVSGAVDYVRASDNLVRGFTRDELIRGIDLLVEAEQVMRRSAHPRVVLEVALMRYITGSGKPSYDELLARIERLENALASLLAGQSPVSGPGTGAGDVTGGTGRVPSGSLREPESPGERVVAEPETGGRSIGKAGVSVTTPVRLESGPVKVVEKAGAAGAGDLRSGDEKEAPPVWEKIHVGKPLNPPEPAVRKTPGGVESSAITGEPENAGRSSRYGIEQIRRWWPDMMQEIKRANPVAYTYLSLVWPAEVKDNCLILGVPAGDVFSMQMAGDDANRELLAGTLRAFTGEKWAIRCSYYDVPPPGWETRQASLEPEEAISLFRGEEVPPPGDLDKN